MVFLRDDGSEFDAPVDVVWRFIGSGDRHSSAHKHRAVQRESLSERSGRYSWEQLFDGAWTAFTMRWISFWPVGVAYDVEAGPFAGSRFFLIYEPKGERTGVGIVGEFVSPTVPEPEVEVAVRRFFDTEFLQDSAALRQSSTH